MEKQAVTHLKSRERQSTVKRTGPKLAAKILVQASPRRGHVPLPL